MSKNYVKVLFGNLFTGDGQITEDKIVYVENPRLYLEMEAAGIVKLFESEEEAKAFKPNVHYWPSEKLFSESVPSLNNSNIAATYDFARSRPTVTAGVPANLLGLPKQEEVLASAPAPAAPAKQEEAPAPAPAPTPAPVTAPAAPAKEVAPKAASKAAEAKPAVAEEVKA